ncbi:M56 family metallopeptidase [Granulicoccus phenolivorans]|uniref:M56 family metallopeptidase n=1 Tax=Granulicoccus phenolivorans TaxID=266854 RepID=UPI0003FF0994|nr:M56 family metallopeptidase [Granulicoccus phenolivorans]
MVLLSAVLCAGVVLAAVCTVLAPPLLSRARWQVWRPRCALACWHAALVGGLAALVCGVGCAVLAARLPMAEGPAGLIRSLAGWCCVFVLGAGYALLMGRSEPVVRRELGVSDRLRAAVLDCPQEAERRDGVSVRYVDTDVPVAFSFRAPRPTVVIGRIVRAELDPDELGAVICHERAHLRGRHHLAVRLANIAVACLPRFTPARRLLKSTQLLVELAADDAAVRRYGPEVVESALRKMGRLCDSAELAMRAQRLRTTLSAAVPR